jgi:protein MpaA
LEYFGPEEGPVDILLLASMHGDEVESTVVLSEALRRVPGGDLVNPVVLSVNPDGILRGTRCNANGVDLNRNWPSANWSPEPVYHKAHGELVRDIALSPGARPASEPETRALLELVQRLQPRAVISLHAPLACIDAPSSSPLARWIARQADLPLVADVGYETPGSFGSWSAEQGLDIITWELPPRPIADLLASHAPVLYRLITSRFDPSRE